MKKILKMALIMFLAIGATLFGGGVIFAEDGDLQIEDDGLTHVGVSPYDLHIDLKPGEHYEGTFKVLNTGAEEIEYTLSSSPYQVSGEDYLPDYVSETNRTQIAKWITFEEDSGKLGAGKMRDVTYYIDVPMDVPAGGQYAAIAATAVNNPDDDSGFSLAVSVSAAMIVYANMEGETRIDGDIISNEIKAFRMDGKIDASSKVKNTGNTHIDATYALEVYPLFSDEEIYTNLEEPDSKTVMPDTERLNIVSWDDCPKIGIFKVKQIVEIAGNASTSEQLVVLCPIWLLSVIVLIIIGLIMMIFYRCIIRPRHAKKD